jgi:hypothetical protein
VAPAWWVLRPDTDLDDDEFRPDAQGQRPRCTLDAHYRGGFLEKEENMVTIKVKGGSSARFQNALPDMQNYGHVIRGFRATERYADPNGVRRLRPIELGYRRLAHYQFSKKTLTFAFYSPIVWAVEETGNGPAICKRERGVKRQPAPLPSMALTSRLPSVENSEP